MGKPEKRTPAQAAEAEMNAILVAMLALGPATYEQIAASSGVDPSAVKRRLNQNGPGTFRPEWKKVEHRTDGLWAVTNLGRRIAEQLARDQVGE